MSCPALRVLRGTMGGSEPQCRYNPVTGRCGHCFCTRR